MIQALCEGQNTGNTASDLTELAVYFEYHVHIKVMLPDKRYHAGYVSGKPASPMKGKRQQR